VASSLLLRLLSSLFDLESDKGGIIFMGDLLIFVVVIIGEGGRCRDVGLKCVS
jgi:hypothetical protein